MQEKNEWEEVSKEEILKLEKGKEYKIYNPYSNQYKMEIASTKDIAHNKYAVHNLKYFKKVGKK